MFSQDVTSRTLATDHWPLLFTRHLSLLLSLSLVTRHLNMLGKTLAHYTITEKLGAGGMGEVYRANDAKLGRDVAIKLLPEAVANDQDRLARFEREAKVLASLNHPNIASIYGLEEDQDVRFLVLELVEGETLAEFLEAGALPLEFALRIAAQVADALEAAHHKGIVHRDLKPANIKVTPDGKVKCSTSVWPKRSSLMEDPHPVSRRSGPTAD